MTGKALSDAPNKRDREARFYFGREIMPAIVSGERRGRGQRSVLSLDRGGEGSVRVYSLIG